MNSVLSFVVPQPSVYPICKRVGNVRCKLSGEKLLRANYAFKMIEGENLRVRPFSRPFNVTKRVMYNLISPRGVHDYCLEKKLIRVLRKPKVTTPAPNLLRFAQNPINAFGTKAPPELSAV